MHQLLDSAISDEVLLVLGAGSSEEADVMTGFLEPVPATMVVRVATDSAGLRDLLDLSPDVLILSIRPPEFSCQRILEQFSVLEKAPPVVFVGEAEDEGDVLDFLQHYAADFAFRDQLQHLRFAVYAAYRNSRLLEQTGRRTAEQAAYNQLLHLQTAVEQSANTIVITSTHGEIEYVNPAFERITGYSKDEAIGKTPSVLNSGHHPPEFFAEL